jgi:hypothetical protein
MTSIIEMDEKPAFEIRAGVNGRVWKIYASGRIEGFGPGMIIFNRIPQLQRQSFAKGMEHQKRRQPLARLMVVLRDWWRGYSDADRESYLRRMNPVYRAPGSIIRLTRREMKAGAHDNWMAS